MKSDFNLNLEEWIQKLNHHHIDRFYFILDFQTNRLVASHALLQPIADLLSDDIRDFSQHEGLFFQVFHPYRCLMGAFIHKTNRGQGAGGIRNWTYERVEDYLRDGLRLSKGMTQKNALAYLWWGGGKGVIWQNDKFDMHHPGIRQEIYQAYGQFLTSLNGCYIAAEDVGTDVTDMNHVFSKTRFTTCISPDLGGSGNPSIPTAKGVVNAMEAALYFMNQEQLKNKKIIIQGLGHVGRPLVQFLSQYQVAWIQGYDINPEHVDLASQMQVDCHFEASLVNPNEFDFMFQPCDILAPCAVGGILNPRTIPYIQASIICGAANNQLEDAMRDAKHLYEKNIIYVPDFLVNRMGIVTCSNEQYGILAQDSFINRHYDKKWKYSIYQTVLNILNQANDRQISPACLAIQMADQLAMENHPIFGHRSKNIIQELKLTWREC